MRPVALFKPLSTLALCTIAALALPPDNTALAQVETRAAAPDANRMRISDALAKGDLAAADKLQSDLSAQSAKAAAVNGSIAYERLTACGFYPQETRLECILDINLPLGFGGGLGAYGSYEFVHFYVDLNGDAVFVASEFVGAGIVHAHDSCASNCGAQGQGPVWQYAVYRDFTPPGAISAGNYLRTDAACPTTAKSAGCTRLARAILSWNAPPTGPNFVPVWGNVVNFRIRFDPIH